MADPYRGLFWLYARHFPFLRYEFYEPVYYYDEPQAKQGYTVPKEKLGRWCGPTEHCGSDMTTWILTDDTNELIARSITRSAVTREVASPVNLRAILDSPVQPDPSVFYLATYSRG